MEDKEDKRIKIWGPIIGFVGGLAIMTIVYLPILEKYIKWNRTEKAWQEHLEHNHVVTDTTTVRNYHVE